MRVPLIFTMVGELDNTTTTLYPAIKSSGELVFGVDELGNAEEFTIDAAESMDKENEKLETTFWLDGAPAGSWTAYVTPERLVVYNPYSKGMLGGVKKRAHKACAGHVQYKCLAGVSAAWKSGNPALALYVIRKDRSQSMIILWSSDENVMRAILSALHGRVSDWLHANKRWLSPEGMSPEAYEQTIASWDALPQAAWKQPGEVEAATVPYEQVTTVPNSRR